MHQAGLPELGLVDQLAPVVNIWSAFFADLLLGQAAAARPSVVLQSGRTSARRANQTREEKE